MMRFTRQCGELNWHNAYPVEPNLDLEELIQVYKIMLHRGGLEELEKYRYYLDEYFNYKSEEDHIDLEAYYFISNYAIKDIPEYIPEHIKYYSGFDTITNKYIIDDPIEKGDVEEDYYNSIGSTW